MDMPQFASALALVVVMVLSGLIGAVCRAVAQPQTGDPVTFRILLPGVAAALVIPLFLSLGGSSIFVDALAGGDKFYLSLFLIAGFCILAGLAGQNFLGSLAARALNTAKRAEDKAEHAETHVEAMAENLENEGVVAAAGMADETKAQRIADLQSKWTQDSPEYRLLGAMADKGQRFRTLGGLVKSTFLPRALADAAAKKLVASQALAESVSPRSGVRLFSLGAEG